MSEHVSVETARALADAGLRREWRVGDYATNRWMLPQMYGGIVYQLAWGQFTPVDKRLLYVMRGQDNPSRWRTTDCLWLPRAGDLLQELAQRKAPYTVRCFSLPDGYTWQIVIRARPVGVTTGCADLAEAAGLALLAVLQEEVQG